MLGGLFRVLEAPPLQGKGWGWGLNTSNIF